MTTQSVCPWVPNAIEIGKQIRICGVSRSFGAVFDIMQLGDFVGIGQDLLHSIELSV